MFLTNNTMRRFGIEYSYIVIGKDDILKSINGNIKNTGISQTNAIAIVWNSGCIVSLVSFAFSLAVIIIISIFGSGIYPILDNGSNIDLIRPWFLLCFTLST